MSSDDPNSCVICLDSLAEGSIGAVAPCGHCFHVECYQGWARHGGSSCPTCKRSARSFCKLFLDLEGLQQAVVDEDDLSLSSIEEENDGPDEKDDPDENETVEPSEEKESNEKQPQEDDHTSSNNDDNESTGGRSPIVEDREATSVEGRSVVLIDDSPVKPTRPEVVDLDQEDEVKKLPAKPMVVDLDESAKLPRYKRLAKSYKRKFQARDKRTVELDAMLRQHKKEISNLKDKSKVLKDTAFDARAEYDRLRMETHNQNLQFVQLRRELQETKESLASTRTKLADTEKEMENSRKHYERQLHKMELAAFPEAQLLRKSNVQLLQDVAALRKENECLKMDSAAGIALRTEKDRRMDEILRVRKELMERDTLRRRDINAKRKMDEFEKMENVRKKASSNAARMTQAARKRIPGSTTLDLLDSMDAPAPLNLPTHPKRPSVARYRAR